MNFTSDNTSGVHPSLLAAIERANVHAIKPYGADPVTRQAEALFSKIFEREVATFFVTTGTAANALSLAASVPPWGIVLCHETAHIVDDEYGAPEFFTHGAKIHGIPAIGGKLTLEHLHRIDHLRPAHCLSITQATECGTVYLPTEIGTLSNYCKQNNMILHMDGARFANALVTLGCTPAEMTWKSGVDILSFGATKNGGLVSEAIVVFKPELAADLTERRKRAGHTLSKQWFIAAQFLAYFENDLWLYNARHANAMAVLLAREIELLGFRLAWPVEANELFCIIPKILHDRLQAAGMHYHEWPANGVDENIKPRADETVIRLVTSYATAQFEIDSFIALCRS